MVATVLAGLVVAVPGAPAGAASVDVTLTMPAGGGVLTLRDADEPTALEQPTTVTAKQDDETGEITDGDFDTPDIHVEQYLPEYDLTAFVDAHFVQVGDVTGAVDEFGNVTVRMKLNVELYVEVKKSATATPALVADKCVSQGVNLLLESTSPFDPLVGTVSLLDANFAIPAFGETSDCPSLVVGGLNELMAGSGHRLAFTNLAAAGLIKPPPPGETTTTSLAVTPAGGAAKGDDVTLTATVANTTAPANTPTGGTVRFTDGSTVVGEVGLVDGVATLTTDGLQAGTRSLRAAYLGVGGSFAKSTSARVSYAVGAPSLVSVTGPAAIRNGAGPVEYTAVVRNPGPGGSRTQRADLTIRFPDDGNAFLNDSHLDVEVKQPDNTWAPVALTDLDTNGYDLRYGVIGSLDPNAGVALAAGASRTITFRVSSAADTYPGKVRFSIKLVAPNSEFEPPKRKLGPDDPGGPAPQESPSNNPSMWSRHIDLLPVTRAATIIEPGVFGFAWGTPQTMAGAVAAVKGLTTTSPNVEEAPWRGKVSAFLDGQPVPLTLNTPVRVAPYSLSAALDEGNGEAAMWIAIPRGTAPGTHMVTLTYSGDDFRQPGTSVPFPLYVAPAVGRSFECVSTFALERKIFRTTIDATATAPSVIEAGGTAPVANLEVQIHGNRDLQVNNYITTFFREGAVHEFGVSTTVLGASATLSDGSTASFTRARYEHFDPNEFDAPDTVNPVQTITLNGGVHQFSAPDTPGATVPVAIEHVEFDVFEPHFSLPINVVCDLVDEDDLLLGEVTVGDIELAVEPGVVSAGDDVDLAATVTPATTEGNVVFLVGGEAVSFASVQGGVASTSISSLPVGVHEITAELLPSFDTPAMTSDPVSVTVVPAATSDAESFVVAALWDYTGAVSQADFDAAVAALDGGQTKASFLRELSLTDEYLTHVVDEMYLDTLGRVGDPAGVAFWVGRLRSGYSVARVAASFYGSDEYFARVGGTDEVWVRDLYETLLGRGSDAAGLAYWIGQVPVRGRGGVALAFFQTPESARARVASLYGAFLGRSPNQADAGFWAARVIAQGDLALAVHLTVSDEYQRRAETRFPPSSV